MDEEIKEVRGNPLNNETFSRTFPETFSEKPTKNLGPLATFEGNRDELEPWISQVEAKLQVDYRNYSEDTQFYMLHN